MQLYNPLFAIAVYVIAFIIGFILKSKKTENIDRFESIDGLRGVLAIGVFIHHASIWRVYGGSNSWQKPSSHLYSQLGDSTVYLFFMITSFLFISKLLTSNNQEFNWKQYFVSRFFRIAPMYYFSVITLLLLVMMQSNWEIVVDLKDFFISLIKWFFFIFKPSLVNNFAETTTVNSGVTWSIAFECFFIFILPLIAVFILKVKPKAVLIVVSVCFTVIFLVMYKDQLLLLLTFVLGAIPAIILQKFNWLKDRLAKNIYGIFVFLFIYLSFITYWNYPLISLLFLGVAFTFIALGNTFFGMLKNGSMKLLGDISYSIYLLHGIVLYVFFQYFYGFSNIKLLKPLNYWGIILAITPLLIIISYLGYRYIEKPFISLSKKRK